MSTIISIRPLEYVHILDVGTTIEEVYCGPRTQVIQPNQKLIAGPLPYIVIPPGHYCIVDDPCRNHERGKPIILQFGQCEVHFHGEPFFLYPGEKLRGAANYGANSKVYSSALKPLPVVKANHALLLEATVDHVNAGKTRNAGDQWQQVGPCTYKPEPEVEIIGNVTPTIIKANQALRLRATQQTRDSYGNKRVVGEEWLVLEEGAYLPGTFEKVVELLFAVTLTEEHAIYVGAMQSVMVMGKHRQAGDEWLLTHKETNSFIPPIGVEIIKDPVTRTVLSKNQYCVVLNPVDKAGRPQLGTKEVRRGVTSFFLQPGEMLHNNIQATYILGENEAVMLQAIEEFTDFSTNSKDGVKRLPGEKWMIYGPTDFVPSIHVKVVDRRTAIVLAQNQGIYVRDVQSGEVRAIMGSQAYMLTENEILWKKELPAGVDELLKKGGGMGSADIRKIAYFDQCIDPAILNGRDHTRVVTYRCPGNTACQVYNYLKKTTRVIFGPDLVVLGPHENFNMLGLSAGKPKVANALLSLALMLGPDFISDIIVVETADHARLQIKMAFNNHFEFSRDDPASVARLFTIPDFIGHACNQVAGSIRAMVAQISFDEFHKHSAQAIHNAVFRGGDVLKFDVNGLVISGIDIQSIEPVDMRMRDSLMKSVQMAIEISTKSIEAAAYHEAQRTEQIARGLLERQKLTNQQDAERERSKLVELQALTAAVESTGQAVAEAIAQAEKLRIEGQSEIEVATLQAEATTIEHNAMLETQQLVRHADLGYTKAVNQQEVYKERALTEIQVTKFSSMVATLGTDGLVAMSTAEPNLQLLSRLGVSTEIFTDTSSPISMFRSIAA